MVRTPLTCRMSKPNCSATSSSTVPALEVNRSGPAPVLAMNPTHNRSPNSELATQSRSVLPPLDSQPRENPNPPVERLRDWVERATQPVSRNTAVQYGRIFFMLVKRLAEELSIDPDWVTPVQLVEQ